MTDVYVDLVDGEHATNLFQNGGTRGLDAVSAEEGIDVVGVDAVLVDDVLTVATGEPPQSGDIRSVGRQLEASKTRVSQRSREN